MKFFSILLFFTIIYTGLNAQNCTTMWPYLYPDFQEGTIYFVNGQQSVQKVNIHVIKSTLHFLDQNDIKEAITKDVILVEIGNNVFYSKNGQMMKVLKSNDKGFVALVQEGDLESVLNEGTAAYGASSNSSAVKKLSSIDIGGKTIINHMEIKQNKDSGKELPLIDKYYIATKANVYPAIKSSLEEALPPAKKAELKPFLKKNKIQWKNPESLILLIDFINR